MSFGVISTWNVQVMLVNIESLWVIYLPFWHFYKPASHGQQTLVKGAPLEHELEAFNLERPDKNSCLKSMPVKTLPSLGRTLAKAQAKIEEARKQVSLGDKAVIKTGTTCFRAGCCAVYPNYHTCKHHPGHPVFHEGMKYWSCCNRKTSSFENFLKQEGCTTKADHKWAGLAGAKILDVRHDFHQQGDHVCVNIYAKNVMIESLKVNVNPVFLHVEAEYEAGLANLGKWEGEFIDSLKHHKPPWKHFKSNAFFLFRIFRWTLWRGWPGPQTK